MQRPLRVVMAGHVDHGKSTLIGRLLHDAGALPPGKAEELRKISERRGAGLEWSFLVDALQSERNQALTIDSASVWFDHKGCRFVLIDAPGHYDFLKNMVCGAANADAAIVVVDASEGLGDQTRRHLCALQMLAVENVAVVVNKMDLVDFDQATFEQLKRDIAEYCARLGIRVDRFIPAVARFGDNVFSRSDRLSWWRGPTLLEHLTSIALPKERTGNALCLPIQDVYRVGDERVYVGRVSAGRVAKKQEVVFLPSGVAAKVDDIKTWASKLSSKESASLGDSIGFTLDRDVYLERGETAFLPSSQGVVSDNFSCQLLWLGKSKLQPGKSLCLRVGTQSSNATVLDVESVTDYQTLERVNREWVERNELANITVRTAHPIAIQRHAEGTALGRLAFFDGVEVVGAALVVSIGEPSAARVTGSHPLHHRRRGATSHEPAVFWLTGLPCAGKTTLANALEERLLARGITCCVLDGDDLRATINSDLGFSVEDRLENVRRVAWMAQILSELGFVVIVSLIAPYTASRTQAREIIGESFFEIFVQAELQSCMRRDVKGLYKDAQRGKIEHLTGISAIYEPPAQPDLTIDTDRLNVEASSDLLMEFVQSRLKAPRLTV